MLLPVLPVKRGMGDLGSELILSSKRRCNTVLLPLVQDLQGLKDKYRRCKQNLLDLVFQGDKEVGKTGSKDALDVRRGGICWANKTTAKSGGGGANQGPRG